MLPPLVGSVEFEDVSCSYYPGRPVLQHVSFRAEPGQTIALVGATGSGKTSIANLIPRFYDVDGGRVLVDGHDVRDVQIQTLRQQIGIVMQETLLFADTVRDNIAFGRPGATDAEIRAAARAARADEFIERLPEAYDTPVGERGVSLSGGQKQRIAIARALLMNPAHPDPRRVHLQRRRCHRAPDPASPDRADAEPHHLRHRPPPLHGPRRRSDPRAGGRQNHGARRPRAASGNQPPLPRHLRPPAPDRRGRHQQRAGGGNGKPPSRSARPLEWRRLARGQAARGPGRAAPDCLRAGCPHDCPTRRLARGRRPRRRSRCRRRRL